MREVHEATGVGVSQRAPSPTPALGGERSACGLPRRLRFCGYALDSHSLELWRGEVRLALAPQPARVLLHLAARPGELVTREALYRELWGEGRWVDAGAGLNFCIREIRGALGDTAAEPRFVETLPRRGYRFVAPVEEDDGDLASSSGVTKPSAEPSSSGPAALSGDAVPAAAAAGRRGRRRPGLSTLALGLLAVVATGWGLFTGTDRRGLVLSSLVAVDAGSATAAVGLTEELRAALAARLPSAVPLLGTPAAGQGEGPRGAFELAGAVRVVGARLTVDLRLLRGSDDVTVWTQRLERHRSADGGPAEVEREVASRAVGLLVSFLARPAGAQESRTAAGVEEAMARGEETLRNGGPSTLRDCLAAFDRALAVAPELAAAHAGKAVAWTRLTGWGVVAAEEGWRLAEEAATRALAVDPGSGAALAVRAQAALFRDWDASTAAALADRAVAATPCLAFAHETRALVLLLGGRTDAALAAARRALSCDPFSFSARTLLGRALLAAGDPLAGAAACRAVVELEPRMVPAQRCLVDALLAADDAQGALVAEVAARDGLGSPGQARAVEAAFLAGGWPAIWRAELADATAPSAAGATRHFATAVLHARLGERPAALAALADASRAGEGELRWVAVHPALVDLRSDPAFGELLRELGLPTG